MQVGREMSSLSTCIPDGHLQRVTIPDAILVEYALLMMIERELSSLSTCIPDGHLQGVTIPDAVLIQFDILMMSTTFLETCRGL